MSVPAIDPLPFFFATGIENSYPTVHARRVRVDQMRQCGHDRRWREDFALATGLGVQALRWGPAYYLTHAGPDTFDWSSADEPLAALRQAPFVLIADLCHFGVPDWMGGFLNPAFPVLFAHYARAFAERYPWVRYYTPVNEIFVAARFSGLLGWWNDQGRSETTFVQVMRNLCYAHELAVEAILEVRPDAIFVQGESIEQWHVRVGARPAVRRVPGPPAASGVASDGRPDRRARPDLATRVNLAIARAAHWNAVRFLPLDLTTGRPLDPEMRTYVQRHGVSEGDLEFFAERRASTQRWIGVDYYRSCEHDVTPGGAERPARTPVGLAGVAAQYYDRYRLPLFHCETNMTHAEAPAWLAEQWEQLVRLHQSGVPVTGFTWYSLTDQMDWQYALRHRRHHLTPVGLYTLDRQERPVGAAYRRLIAGGPPGPVPAGPA